MLTLLAAVAASTAARAQAADPAPDTPPPAPAEEKVEGAIGLLVNHSPSFPGAADFKTKFRPAGFIRYGRFTVTGAGGFTTKRKDDVERGLGAQLVRRDDVHVTLALRFDEGRQETDSPFLAGMGKVRKTVRARLSTRWDIDRDWQLNGGVSVDALNHGGGAFADLGVARVWRLTPATQFTLGSGISFGNSRYMQTWHGVTAEQSAASGYAIYTPGAGLRDANVTGVLRSEFAHRWAGFAGFAYSKVLGAAADSPLTRQTGVWLLSGGVVWRF